MVTVVEGCGSGYLAVEWMRKVFSRKMQWPFQHAGVDVLEMDIKELRTQLTTQRLQVVNTAYSSNICKNTGLHITMPMYIYMAHRVPVCCSV